MRKWKKINDLFLKKEKKIEISVDIPLIFNNKNFLLFYLTFPIKFLFQRYNFLNCICIGHKYSQAQLKKP